MNLWGNNLYNASLWNIIQVFLKRFKSICSSEFYFMYNTLQIQCVPRIWLWSGTTGIWSMFFFNIFLVFMSAWTEVVQRGKNSCVLAFLPFFCRVNRDNLNPRKREHSLAFNIHYLYWLDPYCKTIWTTWHNRREKIG